MVRIAPLAPPYTDEVAARLQAMMPAGVPPIALFRTFVRNLPMSDGMSGWGNYYLSPALSLSLRDRELLIDRTTARCGCEYEWGVHIAFFADRIGLTSTQVASLTHGTPTDACWVDDRDRLLLEAADQLHDSATIDDDLHQHMARVFDEAELLDIYMVCGWYHAISYAANAAQVELEEGAPRFSDVD